jgi:Tol biopolymer transport system component
VYSRDEATPNAGRLFVIAADGRGERMATPELTRVVEEDADWSPDGTRIVFERSYDCATELKVCGGLWVVTADGRAERRLTPENPHGVTSELSPT